MPGNREVLRNVAIAIGGYSIADPPVLGAFYIIPNINEVIINRNYEDNSGYAFGEGGMVHDPGLENSDVSLTWLANDYRLTGGISSAVKALLPQAAAGARVATASSTDPAVPAKPQQSGKARLIIGKDPTLVSGVPVVSLDLGTSGPPARLATKHSGFVGARPNWAMDISLNQWSPISGTSGGYATLSVGWMVDGVVDDDYVTVPVNP